MTGVGVVVIGRNEGDRLRRCLESVVGRGVAVVYVDSGSTDGSRELARGLGADVVELDLSVPFTAARARNAGFTRLTDRRPDVAAVQFVDGDCEVQPGWLERARAELAGRPGVAVVCGRQRERFPDATVYNRLCDIEWDGPVGPIKASGGNAMMRAAAVAGVGGFDPTVIAAEDDEICLRLRRAGGGVVRIDAPMTVHDAAMTRARQWWRRSVRTGYAYALGAAMHGRGPERHFVREVGRSLLWGVGVPAVAVLALWPTGGLSAVLFALYPLQVARVYRATRRRVGRPRHALAYAVSCVAGKFAEAVGVAQFAAARARRVQARIIEYK